VEFSRELRNDVQAGDMLSVRLWKRPRVKQGGRYRARPGEIQVDAVELIPFATITAADVRRAGEPERETLAPTRRIRGADRRGHARPGWLHSALHTCASLLGWSYRIQKLRLELINRDRVTNTRSGTNEDDDM
jgi:hypothetical protein